MLQKLIYWVISRIVKSKVESYKKEHKMSWLAQKTTLAAIAGILSGIALCLKGDYSTGIPLILISLQQLFQRQATAKVQDAVDSVTVQPTAKTVAGNTDLPPEMGGK